MSKPRPCTCEQVETCQLCWLFHNDAAFRRLWGGPDLPEGHRPTISPGARQAAAGGIVRQAATFAGAVARHVAGGLAVVPEETYQQRLEICRACPNLHGNRCSLCKCRVAGDTLAKARWAKEKCPVGKW